MPKDSGAAQLATSTRSAKRTSRAIYAESVKDFRSSFQMQQEQSETFEDQVHYLDYPDFSVPTIDLPSTDTHKEGSELFMADTRRQRHAGVVLSQSGVTPSEPRWVDQRVYHTPAPFWTRQEGLICYMYYSKHRSQ